MVGKIQNSGCLGVVAGCRGLLGRGMRELLGVMVIFGILIGVGSHSFMHLSKLVEYMVKTCTFQCT